MKREITITTPIATACPHFRVGVIEATIDNNTDTNALWEAMESDIIAIKEQYPVAAINKRKHIAATRTAYKQLGKDPNRYRPSAEALCRRVVSGKELYRINMVVDLINWVSMRYGYSIGGFDAAQIEGNLALGVGEEGEPFEGIGRGVLNIAGLPVYRDSIGGIGTPTSDHERTKLATSTTQLLMLINDYAGGDDLADAMAFTTSILRTYAHATAIESTIIAVL